MFVCAGQTHTCHGFLRYLEVLREDLSALLPPNRSGVHLFRAFHYKVAQLLPDERARLPRRRPGGEPGARSVRLFH